LTDETPADLKVMMDNNIDGYQPTRRLLRSGLQSKCAAVS
jgi:hypothetical protein